MFTDRQLFIANAIISHIALNGSVIDRTSFDTIFTNLTPDADNLEELKREVWFVTASLEKDFNLIRRIAKDGEYGHEVYTALTKEGKGALKKGLKSYFRMLRTEELILKYSGPIAVVISIISLIISL
ncbi:MAG: hypothetical protein JXR50_06360 [Prolixibacteraceae bacterium]|nr:hypothetical protein [Prolixibacteraceae bacterium]